MKTFDSTEMRKFQSCNFSSARGPCFVEKAESIYSKSREMCYHSMFIFLFQFSQAGKGFLTKEDTLWLCFMFSHAKFEM